MSVLDFVKMISRIIVRGDRVREEKMIREMERGYIVFNFSLFDNYIRVWKCVDFLKKIIQAEKVKTFSRQNI